MKIIHKNMCTFLLILGLLLIINCVKTVYSPHAQNEMIPPYNRIGEAHEIGSAFAYNTWIVEETGEAVYIKTYPNASFSIFHNASYGGRILMGIGGIELVGFPLQWTEPGVEGFYLFIKPYAGFQFNGSLITTRLNFSPLIAGIAFADSEWIAAGELDRFTAFQFSFLLHNPRPSVHTFWLGARIAPRTVGAVGGYEYSFNEFTVFRTEYSYLTRLFGPLFGSDEEVRGSVHYITTGIFTRLK
ncbi:hypothetical protein AMJ52_06710 [candidate division TA06 bacterium DG_78]|uniref:Uncharacterized protein n=1 Tax=candidate division TA06 bacterium DG_78 TaxID=1703772 RepID=A0A0S7YCU0_UNCT6|nr:MAG: hypothetical protein AMJ52_06710 [candidate division TA06 bacterium DG_78]